MKVPAAHATHADWLLAPWYVPTSHAVQAAAGATEYRPAAQPVHAIAPPVEYCPDGHVVQADAPVACVYEPTVHVVQPVRCVVGA